MNEMDIPHKFYLFTQQVMAAYHTDSWCFGRAEESTLFVTSSTYREELLSLLRINGSLEYISTMECGKPVFFTDALGLVWIGEWTPEGQYGGLLFLLGPVVYGYETPNKLEQTLRELHYSAAMYEKIVQVVRSLPVLEPSAHMALGVMMHFIITGEAITPSDCVYQREEQVPSAQEGPELSSAYEEGYWKQEAALMRIIREGDVNALQTIDGNAVQGRLYDLGLQDPLRNMKDALIVLTCMSSRAAMQGGLSHRIATSVERHYLTAIESTSSAVSLTNLRFTIIRDFTERVARLKGGVKQSKSIQVCCDYIQAHLLEDLTLENIARHTGYAEYYLTKKFARETGMKLGDYIKKQRVEYARLWLLTTDKSIEEISEELQFGNRSCFGKIFKTYTGMTPAAFRAQYRSGHGEESQ